MADDPWLLVHSFTAGVRLVQDVAAAVTFFFFSASSFSFSSADTIFSTSSGSKIYSVLKYCSYQSVMSIDLFVDACN